MTQWHSIPSAPHYCSRGLRRTLTDLDLLQGAWVSLQHRCRSPLWFNIKTFNVHNNLAADVINRPSSGLVGSRETPTAWAYPDAIRQIVLAYSSLGGFLPAMPRRVPLSPSHDQRAKHAVRIAHRAKMLR